MSAFINQYSFALSAFALLVMVGFILLRNKPRPAEVIAFSVVAIGIFAAWLALRPTQTPLMGEAGMVQGQIGAGKPVLLEFQSPYCVGCAAIKPVVDALEQELGSSLVILRVNVQSEAGRELAQIYKLQYTPTFIFFDASGAQQWKSIGSLDAQKVRDSLK